MSLDDRRQDIEARYVHDQELKFRILARRNKLLGLWAAGQLGKSGDDAERYAQDVVRTSFAKPGDEGVFERIRTDFTAAAVQQSDHQIRRHMHEFLADAETQINRA